MTRIQLTAGRISRIGQKTYREAVTQIKKIVEYMKIKPSGSILKPKGLASNCDIQKH